MNVKEVVSELKKHYSKKNIEGMKRFAIPGEIGISIPVLRAMAKKIGPNHKLALDLWKTGIHEARMLACFLFDHSLTDEKLLERLVNDFKSWDLCDQCCSNLIDQTKYAWKKAVEWTSRKEEFVKRSGFVMMACLAVHDKQASDAKFVKFFPYIVKHSTDDRNFVKKAVNWALRQIGKRNKKLNKAAIKVAKDILKIDDKTAKWIARDALRELESEKIQKRLK